MGIQNIEKTYCNVIHIQNTIYIYNTRLLHLHAWWIVTYWNTHAQINYSDPTLKFTHNWPNPSTCTDETTADNKHPVLSQDSRSWGWWTESFGSFKVQVLRKKTQIKFRLLFIKILYQPPRVTQAAATLAYLFPRPMIFCWTPTQRLEARDSVSRKMSKNCKGM